MSRRSAAKEARKRARASLSDASRQVGGRDELLRPLGELGKDARCFWCGEHRANQLRVGRLGSLGYGVYCTRCKADGSGKD